MDEERKVPLPKWLDPNQDRLKRSIKNEARLARQMGGKRIPRSGGLAWSKWDEKTAGADLGTKELHIENKRTEGESISVKKEWLDKVSEGARRQVKDPAVILTFEKKEKKEDWILLPLDVFLRMKNSV